MSRLDLTALEKAVQTIPPRLKGPGGVVGVVKDGSVVIRHAWGYAAPVRRAAMTTATRLPICSISKQFTCGVLLELEPDVDALNDRLVEMLPAMETARPPVSRLCHNQSGLRDYWALTVLHGAFGDGVFRRSDARQVLGRMRTTHFAPGSRYSYSNGNFRILSDLIEARAGRPLADLYRERIFDKAGMERAELIPDTATTADGAVGHEGNADVGFFPATNRILWTGDAGISASLDDMLAWERFIDAGRDDETSLYRRLSRPQTFVDGAPAPYGFGLAHHRIGDLAYTGHGGALRGFRSYRLYMPAERLSVVVMLNHEGNAEGEALRLLKAGLGLPEPAPQGEAADPAWAGRWLEPETGLLLTVERRHGAVDASFAGGAERLVIGTDGVARSAAMVLARQGDDVSLARWRENLTALAKPVAGEARAAIAGRYRSGEIDGTLEIVDAGGAFHAIFTGFLGTGEPHPLYPVGEDVWAMPTRRTMDAPAPGDWTVRIRRDGGTVAGLSIGCWLARNVPYAKL